MYVFDKIVASNFYDQADGTTVFYPNGSLSCGRVIDTAARKEQAFQTRRCSLFISTLLGVVSGVFVPIIMLHYGISEGITFIVLVAILILVSVLHCAFNWWSVYDLPITDIALDHRKSARALPLGFWRFCFWLGVALLSMFGIVRLWFPEELDDFEKSSENAAAVVFSAAGLICLGWWGCRAYTEAIVEPKTPPMIENSDTESLKEV
eukprot:TRINITY_DN17572_c0_g1_i1.p1 TRINITY_DN17572_c0_g1~~TRINITY_DN17572_c0_g1_i1.p1  ORF type:complete len:229 (+),score=15.18 TRINITY_DN17572_c0_g1_i1:68-688(+)